MSAPTINPGLFGFAPPHGLLTQGPPQAMPVKAPLARYGNGAVGGMVGGNVAPAPAPTGAFNPGPGAAESPPSVDPSQFAIAQAPNAAAGMGQMPVQPEVNPAQPLPQVRQPPVGMGAPARIPYAHQHAIARLRGMSANNGKIM